MATTTLAWPGAAEPVLDAATLDANTMSDTSLQSELFDLYFEQSERNLIALAAAREAGDRSAWRDAAHGVKGTARTLGFLRLAACAADAEESGPSAERLDRLRDELMGAVGAAQSLRAARAAHPR